MTALTRKDVRDRVARWFDRRETSAVLKDLKEYAPAYYRLYAEVRASLETKTDAELRRLVRAVECVSSTNCGWTSYEVASLVTNEARVILYARQRAEEETS